MKKVFSIILMTSAFGFFTSFVSVSQAGSYVDEPAQFSAFEAVTPRSPFRRDLIRNGDTDYTYLTQDEREAFSEDRGDGDFDSDSDSQ